jgi:hypothetical protein
MKPNRTQWMNGSKATAGVKIKLNLIFNYTATQTKYPYVAEHFIAYKYT